MSSFSGAIQRPLVAAAAVAAASLSTEKFPFIGSSRDCSTSNFDHSSTSNSLQESYSSLVSRISDSKLANLYFVNKIRVPVPNVNYRVPALGSNLYYSSVASSPIVQDLYQSAELTRFSRLSSSSTSYNGVSNSTSEFMYKWHLPEPNAF
ncbi:transmembrane protein 53-like, partial [Trifolium medium]|nr:transmembrane protein 53-like [Trifolium medium]